MNTMRLLNALTGIDSALVEQAAPGKAKKPRWVRALAAVACLALVIGSAGTVIDRLGLFRAGCSAWPGDFIDGRYYYRAGHGALYCWDSGQNTKVLGALQADGKLVNEYGIYYKRGKTLYVKPHDTGKSQKLYTAPLFDCSHIGFDLYGEDVIVTVYNKWQKRSCQVLVDGHAGGATETVFPWSDYDYRSLYYSQRCLRLGDRTLMLEDADEPNTYTLSEQGVPLLEPGFTVSAYARRYGDQLWFAIRELDNLGIYFVVRADGGDRMVIIPNGYAAAAAGDFAYWTDTATDGADDTVWCLDTRTGESWTLETDAQMEFYEITTDGVHLASCVPWDDYQAMWRIEYDAQGRPAALTLLDQDISD